ncbi:MAG: tetratricopeptide repeat protein [Deltaproteobacteria bacterium]|nr:tetratricopeptide repeat protein [Deltaproteobacteria bacterium]
MFHSIWQWFLETNNQILILGFGIVFIIGLIIGRLTYGHKQKGTKTLPGEADDAFFKGIQYILSNDRDSAIEAFTQSVQVNSDTIETYVALGNLYRSKGDIDRAIRIRQTIILRPNIDEQIKLRALFDLGLDYRKGGFLNRALGTFLDVLKKQPSSLETLMEIEKIYEELKDWENAFLTRQKIAKLVHEDHAHILAHHQTEMGKVLMEQGDLNRSKACFERAISIHDRCVDAYLHLGDLYFSNQDYKKAISVWKKVVKIVPRFTMLAYRRLEGFYTSMKNLKPVGEFLKECAELNADAFTHLALARYLYNDRDYDGAIKELKNALDLTPFFWEARKFMGEILLETGKREEALEAYQELIPRLTFEYLEFQCANCGFRSNDLHWQCPQCKKWDTIDFMDSKWMTSEGKKHPPEPSLKNVYPDFEEAT